MLKYVKSNFNPFFILRFGETKTIFMKREILFKAKRVDGGEWAFGGFFHCAHLGKSFIVISTIEDNHNLAELVEVNPETVCQFTGLFDKNGKKIFEGDNISVKEFNNRSFEFPHEEQHEVIENYPLHELKGIMVNSYVSDVKYEEGLFSIASNEKDFYNTPICMFFADQKYCNPISEIEIISNIHD